MSRQRDREQSVVSQDQAADLAERAAWWDVWTTDPRRLQRRGYRSGARAEIGVVRALNLSQDLLFANRSLGAALGGVTQIGVRVLPTSRTLSVTSRATIAVGAAFYRRRREVEGAVVTVGDESVMSMTSLLGAMSLAVREQLGLVFVWSGSPQHRWLLAQWASSLDMACVKIPRDDVYKGFGAGIDAWHLATGMRAPTLVLLEEDGQQDSWEFPSELEAQWKAAANDALTSPRVTVAPERSDPRRAFSDSERRAEPSREKSRVTVGEAYRRAVLGALGTFPELIYVHGESHISPLDEFPHALGLPGEGVDRLSAARGVVLGGGTAIVSLDVMNDLIPLLDGVKRPLIIEMLRESIFEIGDVPIVAPSNPRDLVGFLETLRLHRGPSVLMIDPWVARHVQDTYDPTFPYVTPLSKASVVAQGSDVGIVTWGRGVFLALEVARQASHLSVGVLDVRTLVPLDRKGIADFVSAYGRVLILEGGDGPVAGEIVSTVVETSFGVLKAKPARLSALRATRDMVAAALVEVSGQAVSPPS